MHHDSIDDEIRSLAFEFFFWFSRFEFALKKNGFLKNKNPGDLAKPNWESFVARHQVDYKISESAEKLVHEKPKIQIVGECRGELTFRDLRFTDQTSELEKVKTSLNTVRNNLFHGGKHGGEDWGDRVRSRMLLSLSICILNELAELSDIESDYRCEY